jgi:hypothetical protein
MMSVKGMTGAQVGSGDGCEEDRARRREPLAGTAATHPGNRWTNEEMLKFNPALTAALKEGPLKA